MGPNVQMINSHNLVIDFEIKGLGTSGIGNGELWYTRDGQSWQPVELKAQHRSPYVVEVSEEGLYGFTLVPHHPGRVKQGPQAGEQPQMWAEVDLTKPVVKLLKVEGGVGSESRNLTIRWKASDKNLGSKPITLAYAERATGPWWPIASHVENNGHYVWHLPAGAPAKFLVRVEATDVVGNVGMAQTPKPVLFDRSQPNVAILSVEPTGK